MPRAYGNLFEQTLIQADTYSSSLYKQTPIQADSQGMGMHDFDNRMNKRTAKFG